MLIYRLIFVDSLSYSTLRILINMKFSEINDPNGICKDITGLGHWGNGDVELFMEHQDELDQIMEIVKQSFDAQAE